MDDARRRYTDDVPADFVVRLRERCLAMPDAYEERAWVGTRWMVRKRTFAHVLGVEVHTGPQVVLSFRSAGDELEALRNAGHPFFVLGWGRDAIGMVLDTATDWDEVRELLIESFCVLAPQKLIALVDRPDSEPAGHDGGVVGLQRIGAGLSDPQLHSSPTG
jgi:YjbR